MVSCSKRLNWSRSAILARLMWACHLILFVKVLVYSTEAFGNLQAPSKVQRLHMLKMATNIGCIVCPYPCWHCFDESMRYLATGGQQRHGFLMHLFCQLLSNVWHRVASVVKTKSIWIGFSLNRYKVKSFEFYLHMFCLYVIYIFVLSVYICLYMFIFFYIFLNLFISFYIFLYLFISFYIFLYFFLYLFISF